MIDIENVADAIAIDWRVAHQADNQFDWLYRWGSVANALQGMGDLIIYSSAHDGHPEMLDEVWFLRDIADLLRFSTTLEPPRQHRYGDAP